MIRPMKPVEQKFNSCIKISTIYERIELDFMTAIDTKMNNGERYIQELNETIEYNSHLVSMLREFVAPVIYEEMKAYLASWITIAKTFIHAAKEADNE